MILTPLILGHGRAGEAIARSFSTVALLHPELNLETPRFLERNVNLSEVVKASKDRELILCLSQPHALHADAITAADKAGIKLVFSEKPICTDLKDITRLQNISAKVAVFHGYRQTWAIQKMRSLIETNQMGEIISIEGKYWQSSAAQKSLEPSTKPSDWKNDTSLSGPYDVLLDLGTHWADLMIYLMGEIPLKTKTWISHINAEAGHRDTHIHLLQEFAKNKRTLGSISKTVHGAKNDLELTVVGEKKSMTWRFENPDQIKLGVGREYSTLTRASSEYGSGQSAFHALGWLEGYIEIIKQGLFEHIGRAHSPYPNLKSSLTVVESLLKSERI